MKIIANIVIGSVLLTGLLLATAPHAQAQRMYTVIDIPGATITKIYGINNADVVVGEYWTSGHAHGFIYSAGAYTTLDVPGADYTYASGINDAGVVVGYYSNMSGGGSFIYAGGEYGALGVPGASVTYAYDINNLGYVVGYYNDIDGNHGFLFDGAMYWQINVPHAIATFVHGINDTGTVVGYFEDADGWHGFTYDILNDQYASYNYPGVPASQGTFANSVNDAGTIVGEYRDIYNGPHIFLNDGVTSVTLNVPDGNVQVAWGINRDGAVSGYFTDSVGTHGFISKPMAVRVLDVPGAIGTEVRGINDAGAVVGTYTAAGGIYGFQYDGTDFSTLDYPGATSGTYAQGINDSGAVVGYYGDSGGLHSFLYSGATYTNFNLGGHPAFRGINNAGVIAGHETDLLGTTRGFTYFNGSYSSFEVPAASATWGYDINNAGTVVGYYYNLGNHGFMRSGGMYTTLDVPAGMNGTYAYGINDAGAIVGYYWVTGGRHGFLYDGIAYTVFDVPGADYTYAVGINNSGVISGYFDDAAGRHGFIATPLRPETRIGVFSNGTWYLDANRTWDWNGAPPDILGFFGVGLPNVKPVTGDWNGDGRTEIGAFSEGTWYLDMNNNWQWDGEGIDVHGVFGVGLPNVIPVTGDWNGDGRTEIGVYSEGYWYLDKNQSWAWEGEPTDTFGVFGIGLPNVIPVTGDWNADGTTEIGVYSEGNWYLDKSQNWQWDGTPTDTYGLFGVGLPNVIPVTGDWNGDNRTEIGVYSEGNWYLDTNASWQWDGTPIDTYGLFGVGLGTVVPVTGNW